MYAPWDPGLQPERTGLAWQRTMLSGLACSLLIARLLSGVSLPLAVVTGLAALVGTAALGWVALRRFHTTSEALFARRPVGDARAQIVLTALVVLTSIAALGYVLIA